MAPRKATCAWLAAVLWMGLIFWLSSIPDLSVVEVFNRLLALLGKLGIVFSMPALDGSNGRLPLELILRKSAHVVTYMILTALLHRACRFTGPLAAGAPQWAAGMAAAFAATDEFHQLWVPGRDGRTADIGWDTLGITIMLLVLLIFRRDKP